MADFISVLCGSEAVVGNVCGLEVWSDLSPLESLTFRTIPPLASESHLTTSFLEQILGVPAGSTAVIGYPVDVTRFRPEARTTETILPQRSLGPVESLRNGATQHRPRVSMPPDLRAELRAFYAEDVSKLERLLGREFVNWRQP